MFDLCASIDLRATHPLILCLSSVHLGDYRDAFMIYDGDAVLKVARFKQDYG